MRLDSQLNPARSFLAHPGPRSPEDLVRAYAHFLLESADAYRLPVPLDRLKNCYSIPVYQKSLTIDQRGFTTADLRIYLNADDLPTVRNFTFAHELMEFLFLALRADAADYWMDDRLFTNLLENKEKWCEIGAAELLMPLPLFADLVRGAPLSFPWARHLANYCQVSLTATIWRILETGLVQALFIIWKLQHSSGEFIPSEVGQTNLFGSPEAFDPPKKLRIERVFTPPRFSPFVPKQKSVPFESLIFRAYEDGTPVEGWDELDLGKIKGRFRVEAVPFKSGQERRIMSLIYFD